MNKIIYFKGIRKVSNIKLFVAATIPLVIFIYCVYSLTTPIPVVHNYNNKIFVIVPILGAFLTLSGLADIFFFTYFRNPNFEVYSDKICFKSLFAKTKVIYWADVLSIDLDATDKVFSMLGLRTVDVIVLRYGKDENKIIAWRPYKDMDKFKNFLIQNCIDKIVK